MWFLLFIPSLSISKNELLWCFYKDVFWYKKCQKKVFGNSSSSHYNDNENDTSLFLQKPYLRTNYIKSIIGEDIDLKIITELLFYLIQ